MIMDTGGHSHVGGPISLGLVVDDQDLAELQQMEVDGWR